MRKRFEQQLGLGQLPIEEIHIKPKSKNALDELVVALKAIYCNKYFNERIFSALESHINELEHRRLERCPDRSYPHF